MNEINSRSTEELLSRIEVLKDQVKKLSAGELHQYNLQMKLDFQLKTQEEIINLGHRIQTVHNEKEIAVLVAQSLVECFEYEKSVFCLWDETLRKFSLAGMEGYYEAPEPAIIRDLLLDLLEIVKKDEIQDIIIEQNMPKPVMAMDKRVLICCRLGKGKILGIIVFGNSRGKSAYHRSIEDQDHPLWKTIQRMAASALENALLYKQLDWERQELRQAHDNLRNLNDELEEIVQARTAELAKSREEYRRLYLESVRTSERYRTLLDSSADPIVVYDNRGLPVYLNQAFANVFGWKFDEVNGRSIDFVPQSSAKDADELQTLVMKGSKISNFETKRLTKDNRIRDVSISAAAHFDEQGDFAGSIFHIRDITNRKKMEEELLKIRKLESVGMLAGGLAHDFNNILSGILMNAQMAGLTAIEGKDTTRFLKSIESATERAAKLTQQLLTFARGGVPVKKATPIEEFIREAVEFVLQGSKVKCEYNIGKDLPVVEIDEGQMNQVIYNLIANAQQAMPNGGIIRIDLEHISLDEGDENRFLQTFPGKEFIRISIQDTGIGIAEDNMSKIFDPYFTTKEKGSGLGLAITYSIINKHNGYLAVESKEGAGSIFTIYLPSLRTISADIGFEPKQENLPMKGGFILVMDDEETIRELLHEMLNHMGYRADLAKDGVEAIDLYVKAEKAGNPYDVVIMDLTIPGGMGGKEAIEALRKLAPNVKAIVSSGYSNDPVMAEYQKYGFNGVLKKPYQMGELKNLLLSIKK
ncbi:MAG: ATP-binding protein [Pseudomonadota bacterium]